jgi:two-component sensor histidine kinase/CHASE3 domain sensor protein
MLNHRMRDDMAADIGDRRDSETRGEAAPAPADPAAAAVRARLRRRRRATGTIVVGFLLLIGAIVLQGGLVWRTDRLIAAMQDSRAVQLAASRVLDSLLNAESGQRGYLMTSDPTYLESYQVAAGKLPAQLAALRQMGAAESGTVTAGLIDTVATLSQQKMDELAETVALERAGQHDHALAVVRSGRGQNSMNAIRADMAQLQDSLEGPLAQKRLALDALQSWLMLGVLGAMVVALLLAGVLIRNSAQQLRALEVREDTLRRLAAGLERRIAQRTRSLAEANLRFHAALRASGVTVFTQDTELRYTWISKDLPGIASDKLVGRSEDEVLPAATRAAITPVKYAVLRTGDPARAEITLDDHGARHWFDVTIDAQRDADGRIIGIVCAAVEITEQRERESRIRLLMRELTHRSKNLLTVIDAIARQTAANSDGVKDFLSRFRERLQSLAGSHDQLIQEEWQGAWLRELVMGQLGHYVDHRSAAITLDGPRLRVQPEAAQHIGLAMHELATNAAKYGALSSPEGHVTITWDVEQDQRGDAVCHIRWRESGGPPVQPPARRGFGHVVIERTVARALGGSVILEFPPDGVCWTLTFPAEMVTAMVPSAAASA